MEYLAQRNAYFRFYYTYTTVERHIIFYKALTESNEGDYRSTFLPEVSPTESLNVSPKDQSSPLMV